MKNVTGVIIDEEEKEVFEIKEEQIGELVSCRNSLEKFVLRNGQNQNEVDKIRNKDSINLVNLLDDSKSCTFNTDSSNLKEYMLSENPANSETISATPSLIMTTKLSENSKKYIDISTCKWRKILPKRNQVVTEQTPNVLSTPCHQFVPKTIELIKAKPLPIIKKISDTIPSNDFSCNFPSDKITGNKLIPIEVNKYKGTSSLPCISSHVSNFKSVPSNISISKSVTITCKKLSDLQSYQSDLPNEPENRTFHQKLDLVKSINKNLFNILKRQ